MPELPQSRNAWLAGGAGGAVALLALGWFVLIHPVLSDTSATKNQTADAQTQNLVLQGKVRTLQAQDKLLPQLVDQLAQAEKELPPDSELSTYITQLTAQAQANSVDLTSVTAGAPTVVTPGSATGAAVPVADPAGHLFSIVVNVVGTGSLTDQRQLLKQIQTVGPRRALVTSVAFTPDDHAGSGTSSAATKMTSIDYHNTMTLQLQVFVAPQSPADEAAIEKQLASK